MPDCLEITANISIPLESIELTAVRSSGAGGQNVNKVATTVHLRFDSSACDALPEDVRTRLLQLPDKRISNDGVIVIKAGEFRSQAKNRQAALERLRDLLRAAAVEPTPRKKTQVPARSREQRLVEKRHRSQRKHERGKVRTDD